MKGDYTEQAIRDRISGNYTPSHSHLRTDKVGMLIDNGELQKQIVNYSKTRAVYTEYRKAGYSKKFREEYASVLQEKRKAYAEYKQVRTEIRELQNVKANIDYLLESSDKHKIEKEF